MIELNKNELEQLLLTISAYNPKTKELISGLLGENISLGTKRKLQKIHKLASKEYEALLEDYKEVKKECGEDNEKLNKELEILLKEEVKIDASKISMAEIEKISSTNNYNFDIIEKIAI